MHGYWRNSPNVKQKWTDPMKLEIDFPAMNNTPLAAATWQSGGNFVRYQTLSP
jgi:hypothetical protein